MKRCTWRSAPPPPCSPPSLPVAGVRIEHWLSPSGARVYYVASRALPILDVQVDFAAGSVFDPAGKSGTAALTRGLRPRGRRSG